MPRRLSTWQSLLTVARSWRLLSVALLSFSSGLPLGLVWIAIPAWMARAGVDIKVVGLFTLAQAPWSFKFLWSPLMDRYPLPILGRKRGWILVSQVALVAVSLWLAGVAGRPDAIWVIGALTLGIALLSATQDIGIDAYAVEVLEREEHGAAVGARVAVYRAAMWVSGGLAITLSSSFDVSLLGHTLHWPGSWKLVNLLLGLAYLPFLLVTWKAPEPEALPEPPRSLKEAVWEPFVGFLAQHRALEILAFVVLFKLSDNLTQALLRPFFVQIGFNDFDVGVATATIGTAGILIGTFLGGILTTAKGLGPALWISGVLQIFSNLGYAVVAQIGPSRPALYLAQAFEFAMSGLGNGAFGVLLLRLTQKRFSATQYALLSSLFSIPRVLAGPPTGLLVDAIGWRDFFIFTIFAGIPGLVMLQRFVPLGLREPVFHVAAPRRGRPLTPAGLAVRSGLGGLVAGVGGLLTVAALEAARGLRAGRAFSLRGPLVGVLAPSSLGEWVSLAGVVVLTVLATVTVAAALVARRGMKRQGSDVE